jgi:hypothetical protein
MVTLDEVMHVMKGIGARIARGDESAGTRWRKMDREAVPDRIMQIGIVPVVRCMGAGRRVGC